MHAATLLAHAKRGSEISAHVLPCSTHKGESVPGHVHPAKCLVRLHGRQCIMPALLWERIWSARLLLTRRADRSPVTTFLTCCSKLSHGPQQSVPAHACEAQLVPTQLHLCC